MDDLFGFGNASIQQESNEEKTNLETGNVEVNNENGERVDNLDDNQPIVSLDNNENNEPAQEGQTHNLEVGTTIEFENNVYTVNEVGDLVDKDGKVFKQANEVAAFIEGSEVAADENDFNIANIIKEVGVEITDESGNVVEFDSTPTGVASYINGVLDLKRTEFAQAGVQSMLEKYPIVGEFLNYYIANGNSAKGFGEQRDRSSIVVSENNIIQQESIVREAWKESNRPGDVDTYIKYLKDTNQLFHIASVELEALKAKDASDKIRLQQEAEAKLKEDQENSIAYWSSVKEIVDNKEIAGYKIPDTIIVKRGDKTMSATPNDFFNYLYQVDDEGYSRYERDLMNQDARKRTEDNMLAAYLMFTGNGYGSLVDMAIAKKEAQKLKIKSAENTARTIKITKPKSNAKKQNVADIISATY